MKNVLVYPTEVCISSKNSCALLTSAICQLSQNQALNGWESRAGMSNQVPQMLRRKCWLWCICEWIEGPAALPAFGQGTNCSVCGPIPAAHMFPCQVMEIQEENGMSAGRNTGSFSARSLRACPEKECVRN